MIKIIKIGTHPDMQSGESNIYKIEFEGITVNEVLQEIKEYTTSNSGFAKTKEGYGSESNPSGCAWKVTVNNKIVSSAWIPSKWDKYYDGNGAEKVKFIQGTGGWYCGIDFNIVTERG